MAREKSVREQHANGGAEMRKAESTPVIGQVREELRRLPGLGSLVCVLKTRCRPNRAVEVDEMLGGGGANRGASVSRRRQGTAARKAGGLPRLCEDGWPLRFTSAWPSWRIAECETRAVP